MKREVSAFIYYRKQYRADHKNLTAKESDGEASKAWKAMSEAEKAPFKTMSSNARDVLKQNGQWSRSSSYKYVSLNYIFVISILKNEF
jgi:hypothetical protein